MLPKDKRDKIIITKYAQWTITHPKTASHDPNTTNDNPKENTTNQKENALPQHKHKHHQKLL